MLKQTRDLVLTSDIEGPVALGDFWEIFSPHKTGGKECLPPSNLVYSYRGQNDSVLLAERLSSSLKG